MSFIKKIQNKTHAEKMRIIWISVGVFAILLIVLWFISKNIEKSEIFKRRCKTFHFQIFSFPSPPKEYEICIGRKGIQKDSQLINTFDRGVQDAKDNYNNAK